MRLTLQQLLDFRDAIRTGGVWIGSTSQARRLFDRAPTLEELVEIAIDAAHAEAEVEERS